jgi:hypothetical protein
VLVERRGVVIEENIEKLRNTVTARSPSCSPAGPIFSDAGARTD